MQNQCIILGYPRLNHERNYVHAWMPYALFVIAKAIESSYPEIDVVIFDGHVQSLDEWDQLLRERCNNILFVGLSIMTGGGQIKYALDMAERMRDIMGEKTKLVFGGPHVNVLPEDTLRHPLVDVVLFGPGQYSVPAFIEALKNDAGFENVPGLLMKNGKKIIKGQSNPLKKNLFNGYPWHIVDIEKNIRKEATLTDRTFGYISSFGCPYGCRFCYEGIARGFVSLDATTILDDVEMLVNEHNVSGIKFYDADFFIQMERVQAFCEGLLTRKLDVKWAASIHPKDVARMDNKRPGLLDLIAKTGCSRLLMGIESGSNRVLKEIVDKKCTVEMIAHAVQRIAGVGIRGSYTFIIGFPGESAAEKQETIAMIERLRRIQPEPEIRAHLYMPYPGTPLFDEAVRRGFVKRNSLELWSDCDYYKNQTPWTSQDDVQLIDKLTSQQNLIHRGARYEN